MIAKAVADVETLLASTYKNMLIQQILVVMWLALQLNSCQQCLATDSEEEVLGNHGGTRTRRCAYVCGLVSCMVAILS